MKTKHIYLAAAVVLVPAMAWTAFKEQPKPECHVFEGTAKVMFQEKVDGWWECHLSFDPNSGGSIIHFRSRDRIDDSVRGRKVRIEVAKGTEEVVNITDLGIGVLEDRKQIAPWWNPD